MNARRILFFAIFPAVAAPFSIACSSSEATSGSDAGVSLGDAGYVDAPEQSFDKQHVDGGYAGPGGVVLREDRFVMSVVSFTPGDCAGFGVSRMPDVVMGPPVGGGALQGGLDVVSLGYHGEIVLRFGDNAIIDGAGPDFIVFENAFYAAGDTSKPSADPGEVSVSEDGQTWKTFACTPGTSAPYGACAGWHAVFSAPGNEISPFDPQTAGGDAFDLADVGLTKARYVRIVDKSTITCPANPGKPTNLGFDLDAVAVVHAETP